MNLLLDTHAWLWALDSPDRLTPHARDAIAAADRVLVSAASLWEIGIKYASGKVSIVGGPARLVVDTRSVLGATELPIEYRHAIAAARLPSHHKDPFDRMLVGQAMCDGLTLVTTDSAIRQYAVATLWARGAQEGSAP